MINYTFSLYLNFEKIEHPAAAVAVGEIKTQLDSAGMHGEDDEYLS